MSETNNGQKDIIWAHITSTEAYLNAGVDDEPASILHSFPTTGGELRAALQSIGVAPDEKLGAFADQYDAFGYFLTNHLPRTSNFDELNYLAELVGAMSEEERLTFGAVMETGRHCGSMAEIVNTALNLNCFELHPGRFSDRDFGGIMFEMHGDQFYGMMEQLRTSENSEERSFAAYVERLNESVNLQKYGTLSREAEGGFLTENGYLQPTVEDIPKKHTGPEDIPAEYRISAQAEKPEQKTSLLAPIAAAKAERTADAARTESTIPSGPEL